MMAGAVMGEIREAWRQKRRIWRLHAQERMIQRKISRADVEEVVTRGEIERSYHEDRPFPSYLISGWVSSRRINVVAGWDVEDRMVYIITVFEPAGE